MPIDVAVNDAPKPSDWALASVPRVWERIERGGSRTMEDHAIAFAIDEAFAHGLCVASKVCQDRAADCLRESRKAISRHARENWESEADSLENIADVIIEKKP